MNETSLSLSSRLPHSLVSESWNRLVAMYAPLIRVWLRKYDVQDTDADDLVQEVLLAVSKNLIKFDRGVLVSMGGASIPTEMAKAYLELIPSKVAEIGKEQE